MLVHLDYKEDPEIREINNVTIASIKTNFPEIESGIKILAGDFNDVIWAKISDNVKNMFNRTINRTISH